MKDYVIITETTADLTPEQIEEYRLEIFPMSFDIGEKQYMHYPDAREMSMKEFYAKLRSGEVSKTAQINLTILENEFRKYTDRGLDVLYIAFSSALSGTYNTATMVAKNINDENKEAKVRVVDSRSASMGEGLLAYYACENRKNSMSLEDNANDIEQRRDKLCHWFCVDDLNHLKRGGRVSSTAAIFGTMLGIKPVLHIDLQGRLIPVDKIRGRKQSIMELLKRMKENGEHIDNQTIFISHGDCEEDAKYLEDLIREQFNPRDIKINYIGPIIGTHSGPGTIALFFIGKEK